MVMGRAEAAKSVVKAKKDFGGGFSAWMKTSCDFAPGLTQALRRLLSLCWEEGGEMGGAGAPAAAWARGEAGDGPGTTRQCRAGLRQLDALPWSTGFISGGSHRLRLAQLADPLGLMQAQESSP